MTKTLSIEFDTAIIDNGPNGSSSPIRFQPNVLNYLGKICHELNFTITLFNTHHTDPNVYPLVLSLFESEGIKVSGLQAGPEGKSDQDIKIAYVIGGPGAKKEAQLTGAEYIRFAREVEEEAGDDDFTGNWRDIYTYLSANNRLTKHVRTTKETRIEVEIKLDGSGKSEISTGLNFLDHMLDQIARHGGFDLKINAKGDLHIDEHHTVEDTAITLGETFLLALGDKRGIERYGFCLPMDDALAQVAVDFGGRSYLVWQAEFKREKVGDVPTEMFSHFFKSFSDAARCNLNIKAEGENEHHKIEAIFKAFAKALKMAAKKDLNNLQLPSTKGLL